MSEFVSQYKVGEIISLEDLPGKSGKALRACQINVDAGEPLTVVTNAPNVRQGSRVAVAPVGSTVVSEEGEEITIANTTVGGVVSQGMLCDSRMLGWTGGAAGIAVQIPESIALGAAPPATKPRPTETTTELPPAGEGLYEKKLTKEEKKKLAEERRQARKAAKEAKKAAEAES